MDNTDEIRDMIHSRRRALRGHHQLSIDAADFAPAEIPNLSAEVEQERLLHFSDAATIRERFEMQNFQTAALAAGSSMSSSTKATSSDRMANLAGDFPNVSQKLDDAATKMQKTFSNAKTIVLLKD